MKGKCGLRRQNQKDVSNIEEKAKTLNLLQELANTQQMPDDSESD